MRTEPLTSKVNTGQYKIRGIHAEISKYILTVAHNLHFCRKKIVHMRSVRITDNKAGTVSFFIPGFTLTSAKITFLK